MPRARQAVIASLHAVAAEIGGKDEHVPVVPAHHFCVDGNGEDDFFVGFSLSAEFEHLRVSGLQLVAVGRLHQFAGQRLYLVIIALVDFCLVQVEADEQHLGQSCAEPAVFGIGGRR